MENKGRIIAQGAEALLIKDNGNIIKKRIAKGYRHPLLDEQLRNRRTRSEGKILAKMHSVINVPKIIEVDERDKQIIMEFVDGKVLSNSLDNLSVNDSLKICKLIGGSIAKMHDSDIIHGDLTTSNMILHKDKIYLIDFGLAFHSSRIEDKAVDLHLLRQAFESKHFTRWQKYFGAVLEGYRASKKCNEALKQLERVEARGRYKGKH